MPKAIGHEWIGVAFVACGVGWLLLGLGTACLSGVEVVRMGMEPTGHHGMGAASFIGMAILSCVAMVGLVPVALGVAEVALGRTLRRRRPVPRAACVLLSALGGLLAAVTGLAALAVSLDGDGWRWFAIPVLLFALVAFMAHVLLAVKVSLTPAEA